MGLLTFQRVRNRLFQRHGPAFGPGCGVVTLVNHTVCDVILRRTIM
jgi:hypothetical protein